MSLHPIRCQKSIDNSVTVYHTSKPPAHYVSIQKIEQDNIKFSVRGPKSIPELFDRLLSAIAGLPPAVREAWHSLSERIADLGVNWTNSGSCGTEYDVPPHIIKALGEAGLTLRISVYARGPALDKAIADRMSEARTESNIPTGDPDTDLA